MLLVPLGRRKRLERGIALEGESGISREGFKSEVADARRINELQLIAMTNRKELFAALLPLVALGYG